MNAFLKAAQADMFFIIELFVGLLEILGAIVLVVTAVKCFIRWIHHGSRVRLDLAQGTALALEFKMGGEVLRTVVVREWSELGILGAIILLRGLLAFLIHWEINNEKKDMAEETGEDRTEETKAVRGKEGKGDGPDKTGGGHTNNKGVCKAGTAAEKGRSHEG